MLGVWDVGLVVVSNRSSRAGFGACVDVLPRAVRVDTFLLMGPS